MGIVVFAPAPNMSMRRWKFSCADSVVSQRRAPRLAPAGWGGARVNLNTPTSLTAAPVASGGGGR